jgi:hypothetical protein
LGVIFLSGKKQVNYFTCVRDSKRFSRIFKKCTHLRKWETYTGSVRTESSPKTTRNLY